MKITAVIASPSRDGNTAVLARAALVEAEKAGAETDEIFLADYSIEYCRGCLTCMRTGSCVIDDDAWALKDRLYQSDGIILASPSYGVQPAARMKNFLTDRIGMFTVYTSSLGDKYFAGISTAGGIGANKVARRLASEYVAGFFRRGYFSGSLGVLRGMERIETVPNALEKARRLGRKLADDVRTKRPYPFQKLGSRLMTALLIRRVILRNIQENGHGPLAAVKQNLMDRGILTD